MRQPALFAALREDAGWRMRVRSGGNQTLVGRVFIGLRLKGLRTSSSWAVQVGDVVCLGLQIGGRPVLISSTARSHPCPPRPDHRHQASRKYDPLAVRTAGGIFDSIYWRSKTGLYRARTATRVSTGLRVLNRPRSLNRRHCARPSTHSH
jgi:hypothetical protein